MIARMTIKKQPSSSIVNDADVGCVQTLLGGDMVRKWVSTSEHDYDYFF